MKYYEFKCPNKGLMGKYITLSSTSNWRDGNWDFFSAAEIELFGKLSYLILGIERSYIVGSNDCVLNIEYQLLLF